MPGLKVIPAIPAGRTSNPAPLWEAEAGLQVQAQFQQFRETLSDSRTWAEDVQALDWSSSTPFPVSTDLCIPGRLEVEAAMPPLHPSLGLSDLGSCFCPGPCHTSVSV